MRAGDIVILKARPAWGVGVIRLVEPDGKLLVDFEVDGRAFSDDCHPLELELATIVRAAVRTA